MPATSRCLVVVRHARAEPSALTDATRSLTGAGCADARAAGRWLSTQGLGSAAAGPAGLISSATRTQETWGEMARAAGWTAPPTVDDGLYVAGPDAALDLVRESGEEVVTLVLVGHNPTMGYLAQLLDDGEGDPAAVREMAERGFPTCSLAVLTHDGAWSGLAPGSARLVAFHVARDEVDAD